MCPLRPSSSSPHKVQHGAIGDEAGVAHGVHQHGRRVSQHRAERGVAVRDVLQAANVKGGARCGAEQRPAVRGTCAPEASARRR